LQEASVEEPDKLAETEATQAEANQEAYTAEIDREPSALERVENAIQDITDWLHRMFPVTAATPEAIRPPGTPRDGQANAEPEGQPSGPAQGIVSNQPAAIEAANASPAIAQAGTGNETASSQTDATGNPVAGSGST
jgi:hypothetical protein